MNEDDLKLLGDNILDNWKRFTEAADRAIENYKALIGDIDKLDNND